MITLVDSVVVVHRLSLLEYVLRLGHHALCSYIYIKTCVLISHSFLNIQFAI